jgi:hypothetical protein
MAGLTENPRKLSTAQIDRTRSPLPKPRPADRSIAAGQQQRDRKQDIDGDYGLLL